MRLVYISNSPVPSRTANSVHVMYMCQALAREGFETVLIARRSRELPAVTDDFSFYGVEPTFELVKLRRYRGLGPLYSLSAARTARRLSPDAIYGRDPLGVYWAARSGCPAALDMHDPPRGRLARWAVARLARLDNFKGLTVTSNTLKRIVLEQHHGIVREGALTVAPNGVDLERFAEMPGREEARSSLGLPAEAFVAGYIGQLYEGRGAETLLAAASRLPEVVFLLVGGDPADAERLRAQVKGQDNVRFTGHVPRSSLAPYWSACDALLMPYQRHVLLRDGSDTARWMCPMKMFEYMAAGRPIVSSDLPVLREVLSDEVNALLVDPESVEAWCAAIARLRDDPALAGRLAARARRDVEAYSWRARVRRVMEGVL